MCVDVCIPFLVVLDELSSRFAPPPWGESDMADLTGLNWSPASPLVLLLMLGAVAGLSVALPVAGLSVALPVAGVSVALSVGTVTVEGGSCVHVCVEVCVYVGVCVEGRGAPVYTCT